MDARQDTRIQKCLISFRTEIYGYPLLNMDIKWSDEIPTACVTHRGEMLLNKEWINTLSDAQMRGLFAHEVMHLMKGDLWRKGNRNHSRWNMAIDLTVNSLLRRDSFELPDGGVIPEYNDKFEFDFGPFGKVVIEEVSKKFSEQVYNLLPEIEIKCRGGSKGDGDGDSKGKGKGSCNVPSFDEHECGEDKSAEGKAEAEKWERITRQSIVMMKEIGKMPAHLEGMFENIFMNKVDWKRKLFRYVTNMLARDYTYTMPSKKSQAIGVYLPSQVKEEIEVFASIDTSGSMGQEELNEIMAELIGIAKSFSNLKMRVIECDTEIQMDLPIENGHIKTLKEMKVRGGGGTSHKPVYDYVHKEYPHAKLLINFTDGYTTFPDKEIVPTLWVITKRGCELDNIPFGDKIKLE